MTQENMAMLHALLNADPALRQQLEDAETTNAAAQLLTRDAGRNGFVIAAAAIAEQMEAEKAVVISDEELDAVAGGKLSYRRFRFRQG